MALPPEDQKLLLISTPDLIKELLNRFDDAVFAGLKDRPDGPEDAGHRIICRRYGGDPFMCVALAHGVGQMAQNQVNASITEISEEEL